MAALVLPLFFALVWTLLPAPAWAGGLLPSDDPHEVVHPIEEPWRVWMGDDPTAADPSTSTADWLEVPAGTRWRELGRPEDDIAWYRLTIQVPSDRAVGVMLWYPFGATETWVDGEKLGTQGSVDGRRAGLVGPTHVHVPRESSADGELVVAVRFWSALSPWSDGYLGALLVGPAEAVHLEEQVQAFERWRAPGGTLQLFVGTATAIIGVVHLFLFGRRRELALAFFGVGAVLVGGWCVIASGVSMSLLPRVWWWYSFGQAWQLWGWCSLFVFGHLFFQFPYLRWSKLVVGVTLTVSLFEVVYRHFGTDFGIQPRLLGSGSMALVGLFAIGHAAWRGVPGTKTVAAGFSVTMFWGIAQLIHHAVVPLPWFVEYRPYIQVAGVGVIPLAITWALANRFTGTLDELDQTYRASFRFVPMQFLEILGRKTITEVYRGDNTSLDMTIMFCDIRGFTTLSEARTPQRNFRFINQFLEAMEPHIHDNGGFVGQYLGDGFLALFPVGSSDPVRAAVGMQSALEGFNAAQEQAGEKAIQVGIGLHSGNVMLGTIGGASRLDTGVVSDVVNTGSRVEGLSKMYGAPLVISEATAALLGDEDPWTLQEVDAVVVKGRKAPLRAFEVLDGEPDRQMRSRKLRDGDAYAAALTSFRDGEMAAAREGFEALGTDRASVRLWLDRCDWFLEHGVPDDWDGVVRLTVK